jgi:hypothetical protein
MKSEKKAGGARESCEDAHGQRCGPAGAREMREKVPDGSVGGGDGGAGGRGRFNAAFL